MTSVSVRIVGLEKLQRKANRNRLLGRPLKRFFTASAIAVQRNAKKRAPVDTGRLRRSIAYEVDGAALPMWAKIGTNVEYACVFDAHTRVVTEDGTKTISQVEAGDWVLAQDGLYHPVTATHVFPATEKPDLVEIKVYWRKGGTHTLNLTIDHKVLVYRDGRNKWIPAGEVRVTDKMLARKKAAHNKGTGAKKVCRHCGDEFTGQNAVYCSMDCKHADWHDEGNNPHIGMARDELAKARMSRAAIERLRNNPELHPNRLQANHNAQTVHERDLQSWLDDAGLSYEPQQYIAGKFVDFYAPEINTIYEADGAYWHQNQQIDIERDKTILAEIPGVRIVHVHFYDERFSPVLKVNPLPNVTYVAVNPGMKSYADMDEFEHREVVSVSPWRYEQAGDKPALLYDLTVGSVHSFTANSVIVSNSHQEFGTRPHFPPISAMETWGRRHGLNGFLAAKAIAAHGVPEQRYMRGGLEDSVPEIRRHLSTAAGMIEERWGG